jgi:CBS domain-containing protein
MAFEPVALPAPPSSSCVDFGCPILSQFDAAEIEAGNNPHDPAPIDDRYVAVTPILHQPQRFDRGLAGRHYIGVVCHDLGQLRPRRHDQDGRNLIWVNAGSGQPNTLLATQTVRGDAMRAIDVMTSEVISVDEDVTVPAVARLLAERGISAVPVVDKTNRVIGMVSEGDLLHRAETGTERRRAWWLDMMSSTNRLAGDYIKSHSARVTDVMTRNILSVTETTPIADIALLLETNRIKRVPVVRDGKLVGIVSRANLVRALAMTIDEPPSAAEAGDRTIRDRLLAELKAQRWAEVAPANVTVKDGVVHLWSSYLSEQEKRALVVAAENIPGVRRVEDHMRRVGTTLLG